MIYRTWFCKNRHCRHQWTEVDKDHPPCPRCGNVQVQWIPGTTGVLSGKTRNIDATVKDLQQRSPQGADVNYQSPRRGERMMPKVNPSPAPGRSRKWAAPGVQGWAIDLPETPNGQLLNTPVCAPAGITSKLTAPLNAAAGRHPWAATATGAVPRIEASHRGRP